MNPSLPSEQPISTHDDPTLVWIHVLLNHGGYLSLIGTPAALAIVAFFYRIRWLNRHRQPHGFGRTALIYWPSQILIALSLLPLLALILSFGGHFSESHGLVAASFLMVVAWVWCSFLLVFLQFCCVLICFRSTQNSKKKPTFSFFFSVFDLPHESHTLSPLDWL